MVSKSTLLISSVLKVMEDEQGVSKGFGFVSFEENESAEKVLYN